MQDMDYFRQLIKITLPVIFEVCEKLDARGKGVSHYFSDGKTDEVFKISMDLYALYLSMVDGKLKQPEVDCMNSITGRDFDKSDYEKFAKDMDFSEASFGGEIPVIFRTFVDADNSEEWLGIESPVSLILYEVYAAYGLYIIVCDSDITKDEYDKHIKHLGVIYVFLKQSLKRGFADIKHPVELTKDMLATAELEINEKLLEEKKEDDIEKDNNSNEEEKSLDELVDELDSMIGLNEVKYEVTSLVNLLCVKLLRKKLGLDMPPISLHLVFSGNPGTGKTTVARLLAKLYKELDVLSKGQLVEVDRAGLVGGYVGQTALKVAEVVKSAIGGVLFIDEAYSLTPENSSNDYGYEAVDAIVKAMEDYRNDLIVIVAGYPDLMKKFLASNPGLKSRFNKFIEFRDYNPDELTQIFERFCKQGGYRVSRPAISYIKRYYENRPKEEGENFGNARDVRNLFEYAIGRQANRVMKLENRTPEKLTLLIEDDVSGKEVDLGKQQYLAQKVMANLNREKRHGLIMEYMDIALDELEISAGAEEILNKKRIKTIKDFLDYIDNGRNSKKLKAEVSEAENEIIKKLEDMGFEN